MRYGTLADINYTRTVWSACCTSNVLTLQVCHVSASQVVHHRPEFGQSSYRRGDLMPLESNEVRYHA